MEQQLSEAQPARAPLPEASAERIEYLIRESRAPATRRAYRADWLAFQRWCELRGHAAQPAGPAVVAAYLAEASQLTGSDGHPLYAPNTLARWVAGINHAHTMAGLPAPGTSPLVTATLAGIRRDAHRPVRRAQALTLDLLRPVIAAIDIATWPAAVIGHRDRLVLLVGFATAMRRSELAGLLVGDVTDAGVEGIRIRLRHSKTDQERAGAWRPVPCATDPRDCPVCAWVSWRRLCGPGPGLPQRTETMARILDHDPTRHACRQRLEPYLTGFRQPTSAEGPGAPVAFQPLLRTWLAADGLASAFAPLAPLADKARELATFVGVDPAELTGPGGVRAAVASLAYRLGPQVVLGALRSIAERLTTRIAALIHDGLVVPLSGVLVELTGLLDALSVDPLLADFTDVRDRLTALVEGLRPSTVLAAPLAAFDGLRHTLETFDPLEPVRAVVDGLRAEIDAFAHDFAPSTLLAPLLTAYDDLAHLIGGFDVAGLLEPVLGALAEIGRVIDQGMDGVIDALAKLKAACASDGGPVPGLDVSVAASVDVGGLGL